MKSIKIKGLTIIMYFLSIVAIKAQDLETTVDQLLSKKYQAGDPGATALIAKDGKVIYRKAFGTANLELDIPMKPEHVFELGSISKQFTSVAILMLMEEGKLNITDEITKFIPDYPTNSKKITVHHLLNHTSGIKSYTAMASFREMARTDMSPTELIDVFKNEPMDFDPGYEYAYNNSGYILLGHIIEVVSEMSYADFVEQHIFKKLGMKNSHYGSMPKIIKNRASGYQPTENGFRNAEYLSLTLPYAAGSLMSCVDDMLLWSQAIHNNTLISEKSKQLAFTNGERNDGFPMYYGYGFSIDEINNVPTIEHGGGIFGYETYGVYVPSENVYVIVLTNRNGNGPSDVTVEIAAHAIGKPYPTKKKVSVSEEKMKRWAGTYQFGDGVIRYVTFDDGRLYSQREGSENLALVTIEENVYYFEESFTNYEFGIEDGLKVAYFSSRIRKSKGLESEKKAPPAKKAIAIDTSILKNYVGTYVLQPGFEIVISTKGDQIFGTPTGQGEAELFPEGKHTFFLKVVQAQVIFHVDENGVAQSLTLNQGGRQMEGKKN